MAALGKLAGKHGKRLAVRRHHFSEDVVSEALKTNWLSVELIYPLLRSVLQVREAVLCLICLAADNPNWFEGPGPVQWCRLLLRRSGRKQHDWIAMTTSADLAMATGKAPFSRTS